MASRAKRKKQRREKQKTNGDKLAELFAKGAKYVDITNTIYSNKGDKLCHLK